MKKYLTLLVLSAIAGTGSICAQTAKTVISTTTEDSTAVADTAYFINAAGWQDIGVAVWVWKDDNWACITQRDEITKTSYQVNGYEIYAYTFPKGYSGYAIAFDDGQSSDHSHTTSSLVWSAEKPYFCVNGKYDGAGYAQGDWYASVEDYVTASSGTGPVEEQEQQLWPVLLDAQTYEKYSEYVSSNLLQPDDENTFIYIWSSGETYTAGPGAGLNFFGNTEGYLSLVVADQGWSGFGYLAGSDSSRQVAQQLKETIIAHPEKYYLHIAIKSTTDAYHQFYLFGNTAYSFILGSDEVVDGYDGEKGSAIPMGDFERDGHWHDFYIPMEPFARQLANSDGTGNDNGYYLCGLSGGVKGTELDLDAIYFCDEAMRRIIVTPTDTTTVVQERQSTFLNFSDVQSIDDWTITNATRNETETTMYDHLETYVYDIYANIPGVAYVTDMPDITFTMESTSDKTKAFYVGINRGYYGFYQTGGKNGIITIKNTRPYDIITLEVAAKGATAADFTDPKGQFPKNAVAMTSDLLLPAKNSGAEGEDDSGYTYRTLVYYSTGGDVQIKECTAGFRLRSISVKPGETPTVTVLGKEIPTDTTGVIDIYGDSTMIYDTDENTLTINNLTLEVGEEESTAISYSGSEPLTIVLNDESSIIADTVIASTGDIIITGTGSLVAEGTVPIIGEESANITFDSVNMYVHSLPSAAAVRRRIRGVKTAKDVDENGGPALSGFGNADFNKVGISPSGAAYGAVSTGSESGTEILHALYVQNGDGSQTVVTEFTLTAIPDDISAVEAARVPQSFDPQQPMYNILGVPVDASYRGIVIQNGQKYLLQ